VPRKSSPITKPLPWKYWDCIERCWVGSRFKCAVVCMYVKDRLIDLLGHGYNTGFIYMMCAMCYFTISSNRRTTAPWPKNCWSLITLLIATELNLKCKKAEQHSTMTRIERWKKDSVVVHCPNWWLFCTVAIFPHIACCTIIELCNHTTSLQTLKCCQREKVSWSQSKLNRAHTLWSGQSSLEVVRKFLIQSRASLFHFLD